MKQVKRENTAPFLLVYGDTNSGKSCSIARSSPQPIHFIDPEGDTWKAVDAIEALGETVDIHVDMPETHEDLMESLLDIESQASQGQYPYKTLVFNSGTFWMNVKLAIRVEDDRNIGRKGLDEGKLSAMSKKDYTEVNTVNSQMARLTDLLKSISHHGVMVIMTAQLQENPKWNRELEAGPCFKYKEYNEALKGFFDYIGFTIPRLDDNGRVVYPPQLSFEDQQGYMAKWRGVQPKKLTTVFDLSKRFAWFCK